MLCKLPANIVKNHKNNNKHRKNYRQMRDDLFERYSSRHSRSADLACEAHRASHAKSRFEGA